MAATFSKSDIYDSVLETYNGIVSTLVSYSPRIIGAVLLIVVGIISAKIASYLFIKLLNKFRLIYSKNKEGISTALPKILSEIISKATFWLILLFFIAAAANLLEWELFSRLINTIVSYLPNLFTGLIIIITGYWISNIAKSTFITTASHMHMKNVYFLGSVIYYITLFATVVIGIEQIGINIQYISIITAIVLASLLISFTFSFTLGSKSLVSNMIGSRFAKKICKIGSKIKINDVDGVLIEITQTSLVIEVDDERVIVPAKYIQDNIFVTHNA